MSFKDAVLTGAKGGGGSFKNRPDNLRSTDTFEALIGVNSSRARLAPGGLKNLFVNDVPVEDSSGQASFKEFTAVLWDGDPAIIQPIKLLLGASAGPNAINLAITNPNASAPGDWVTGAVTQPGVDFIDFRFIVSQLFRQDKKGIYEETARLEIELRPSGTTQWVNPLSSNTAPTYNENGVSLEGEAAPLRGYILRSAYDAAGTAWNDPTPGVLPIKGKTTSAYVKELRVAVPNTGAYANKTWEARVRLLDQDYAVSGTNGENEVRRTLSWESIAGVSTAPFGNTEAWRGLSYIQIYGKASDQISGIPEIKGIYDLGFYNVPPSSVWDPATRVYTNATWDGTTTQLAWTQCPAFQVKGLIEDGLSGVSALVPGSTMNKWDALEASKWFATLVPDGSGGSHPRYSANWSLEQSMQVHELVNYLCGAVGAFAWDEGDGNWRMKVEKPESPAMIFTKENIVGEFVYSHTDFDSRFNDFTGVFRNKDNRYEEDRVRVFDQASIDATGRRHTTIALVGCDNRQEALRRLKLRLLTSTKETRMVTFTTNRQGGLLEQFSVIGVADGDLNSDSTLRSTGRVTAKDSVTTTVDGVTTTTHSATVRDPLRLEAGVAYKVHVTIPNPNYTPEPSTQPAQSDWRNPTITVTRDVVNTAAQRGDVTQLYLDAALPADIPDFAPIALEAAGLPALPKQYRVMSIRPDDAGELVTISAIEIYTNKWNESDNVSESEILSQLVSRIVPPATAPANGMFKLSTFVSEFQQRRALAVSWVRPGSLFLDGYRLEMRHNQGPWQQLGRTRETVYEIQEPEPGVYDFRVFVIDRRGKESLPLLGSYEFTEQLALPPSFGLTNEAANVAANSAGTVSSYAQAGGSFWVSTSLGFVTSGVTYSVVAGSATGGLNLSIDAATGDYTVNDLTSDQGAVTLRAVWGTFTLEKRYTIVKSPAGAAGLSSAQVLIYKRSATAPALPTVATTYTFATGDLTGLDNGWSRTPPAGSDPLYVSVATASGTAATDSIAANEWAAPVVHVENGSKAATVYLYKRTTTSAAPALPTTASTYTFSTGALTGQDNGWTQTIPAASDGAYLWITQATALGTDTIDTIAATEWAAASIMARSSDGMRLEASAAGFTFTDGASDGAVTSITFTATSTDTGETINWSTSPAVTLAGTGNTRTLSLADFGANRQVVVTATGATTGNKDVVGVVRIEKSTAAANAGTTLQLTDLSGGVAARTGNSFTRTSGANNYAATFCGPPFRGTIYAEAALHSGYNILNLDFDATGTDYSAQAFAFHYRSSDGAWWLYSGENSGLAAANASGTTTAGATGIIRIVYDGGAIRGYINATELFAVTRYRSGGAWVSPIPADLTLYPKWTAYESGRTVTDLNAGPFTDRAWSNVANRPANLAELAGSEGIRNALVTVNEDGTLGGAGAGQVAALKLPDAPALSTNAQSTSSLFFNQSFDLAKPGTTPARPAGPIAMSANTATRMDTRLGYVGGLVGGEFAIGVGGGNGDTRVYLPMFRLNPKSRYRCRGRVKAASATTSGLYINWQEYDGEPGTKVNYVAVFVDASGEMVVATRGRSTASTALNAGNAGIENAGLTASYQDFSIEIAPTSTAKFASIQIMRWAGMNAVELHFENLVIEEIAPASLADLDAPVNTKVAGIADNAGTTVDLVSSNTLLRVVGNAVVSDGAGPYTAYDREPLVGSASVSATVPAQTLNNTANYVRIGLTDAANRALAGEAGLTGFFIGGSLYLYVGGSYVANAGIVPAAGDRYSVQTDKVNVRFYRTTTAGVTTLLLTAAAPADQTYYAKVEVAGVGNTITEIRSGAAPDRLFDAAVMGPNAPSNNAGTTLPPLTKTGAGTATQTGNTFTKTSANAWDVTYSTTHSFLGTAYVAARIAGTPYQVLGLFSGSTIPTDVNASATAPKYGFYVIGDGRLFIVIDGVYNAYTGSSNWALGDLLEIFYDGVAMRFFKNGVQVHSITVAAGQALKLALMLFGQNSSFTDVQFTSYTDNAFDASKMGPLAPANNATVGAPAGTQVGATLAETIEARANDPASRINAAATLLSATKMQYGPGVLVSDKEPAEAGADATLGKSIDILVDGTTYKRYAATERTRLDAALDGAGYVKSKLLDAAVIGTTGTETALNLKNRASRHGTDGRQIDGRAQQSNRNYGIRSLLSPPTMSSTDDGTTASISLSASSYVTDWGATINLPAVTFSGLAFGIKYYIWRNQPDPETAGDSYGISTALSDAIGPGKSYLAYYTTVADGGTGGGGGTIGSNDCVDADAWVLLEDGSVKRARDIVAGDRIVVLDYTTLDGLTVATVRSNRIGLNETVRLTTESGATLTLSVNTPITLRNGALDIAANAWRHLVPAKDKSGFRWEQCVNVEYTGEREVANIDAGGATYAAGDDPDCFILTHNVEAKP